MSLTFLLYPSVYVKLVQSPLSVGGMRIPLFFLRLCTAQSFPSGLLSLNILDASRLTSFTLCSAVPFGRLRDDKVETFC